jgi:hypothetical protein
MTTTYGPHYTKANKQHIKTRSTYIQNQFTHKLDTRYREKRRREQEERRRRSGRNHQTNTTTASYYTITIIVVF